MRWNNLYVAGLGSYLPPQVETAEEAVAAGRYDSRESVTNGIRQVRVADDTETGPVMAARAGREAVRRAGLEGGGIDLVLHAYVGHQGQELWTPASYVQAETVGGNAPAIEIRQGSNGGLAAVETAASHLAARPDAGAALVTTGDAFRLPYFDRWSSDRQQPHGDGAGALVLSSRAGFARVLSSASYSAPALEPLYRGAAWTDAPFHDGKPVELGNRQHAFLMREENSYEQVGEQIGEGSRTVLDRALADAGIALDDAQFFIHPNVAESVVEYSFYQYGLGVDRSRTVYDWAQDFGHMGAGDEIIGLHHLVESRRPRPGDLAIAMGVGAGFVWTVLVLEFLDVPHW
ncbi:ketoacyl-ACP synthase III family protein [Streptomyces sp. ACA25]|uniref:ketoacyl-ACP synthase III family protein n=1 Tax=Streptomyces sp. ACA25 TaxID=3022596 RepID=UPI002307F52B|nr:ketoacyl-ACP synthase III family protein [Streptomyces sp. ACA25]MDB1089559.1 ketoacyl-ACP synthase III family protein [Streptomyces sp. ACA25]